LRFYLHYWTDIKYGIIFFVGVIADQWTKYWATGTLSFWHPVPIIPPLVQFQLVHNYGAAYGILQNQRLLLLSISGIVIVLAILFHRLIATTIFSKWGLTFLLIGTLGNSIDRLVLGYVVDFIDIKIIPVFNIADIMINLGIICFIIEMIIVPKKTSLTGH
jgi:signal peptidase II